MDGSPPPRVVDIDWLLAPDSIATLRDIFAGFRAGKTPYLGGQLLLRNFSVWCAQNAPERVPVDIISDTELCACARYRLGTETERPPFEALGECLEAVFVPRRDVLFRERFFSPETPRDELIERVCRALNRDKVTSKALYDAGVIEREVDENTHKSSVKGVHPRAEFERRFCEQMAANSPLGAHAALFCQTFDYHQGALFTCEQTR